VHIYARHDYFEFTKTIPDGETAGLKFTVACQPEYRRLHLDFFYGLYENRTEESPGVNNIGNLFAAADEGGAPSVSDIEASCRLGEDEYRYVLHPFVSEGKACGAARWSNARLAIARNGKIIYDAPFAGDCGDPKAPVVSSVTVCPGEEPLQETEPAALFYDPAPLLVHPDGRTEVPFKENP
jgi:hypothetical protein